MSSSRAPRLLGVRQSGPTPPHRESSRFVLPAILVLSAFLTEGATAAVARKAAVVSEARTVVERPVSAKLVPVLRRLVLNHESGASLEWALSGEGRTPLIRTETLPDGSLAAGVFIRTGDVERTKRDLASLGGFVRVEVGDILVAVAPVASLEILAERPETISIEASYVRRPRLDASRPATKADLVQAGTGLPAARTGAGVIVGIVDSGIDFTRADFKTSGGTTRIRSIWDISGIPAGTSTARICSPSEIGNGSCPERDLNGHGTHVAGIAVGAGRLQAGFVGMAPEAEIIAAKATRSTTADAKFGDDDVIDAVNYIFQQAQAAGKPAVVNLSLGGFGGPLDGTSSYEQALSSMTGSGRVVIAAAGNDGDEPVHLSYAAAGSSLNTSLETPWIPATDNSEGTVLFWYGSGSIAVGICARNQSTDDTARCSAPRSPGQSTGASDLTDGSSTVLAHFEVDASTTSYPGNGARLVVVKLRPVVSKYFSLYTFGSGVFDAWGVNMGFGTRTDSYWRPGDSQKTVGTPATALKVIAVGNHTTKTQWPNAGGTTTVTQGFTLGDIAPSSSRGPTRDGRMKPELAAPGSWIASALSVDSVGDQDPLTILQGGKLLVIQGTSMASPHVTGIVALMLQANPALTYDTALQALQNSATKDSFTGSTTNTTWGAGKVNALEAVKAVGGGTQPTTCTPDATTMCLLGGRYRITSQWKNQYAGGAISTLNKTNLTNATGAFWLSDSNSYEYLIRINTATNNGRAWIAIPTFTDVEFWITVQDVVNGQSYTYHSPPGNKTLIYDPFTFVFP